MVSAAVREQVVVGFGSPVEFIAGGSWHVISVQLIRLLALPGALPTPDTQQWIL